MRATARQMRIDAFYRLAGDFGKDSELGEILANGMTDFTKIPQIERQLHFADRQGPGA
jgi:hypothetical protein